MPHLSISGQVSNNRLDLGRIGHNEFLQRAAEWDARHIGSGNTHDRAVQPVKDFLCDDGRILAVQAK
jgi:hypothetical protein